MSGEELRVVIDPKIAFGQPCIMPGRIPVHAIVDRFRAGESVASLCADYEIDGEAVATALLYVARPDWYESRTFAMDLPAPSDETYLALHAMLPTQVEANEINFAMAEIRAAMQGSRRMADEATPWNQEKYDLLTGPWRRVVGSIHPADEVLR